MERLTRKVDENTKHLQKCIGWYELPTNDYYVRLINETPNQMYRKLGQIEDIEEELGIELCILFNDRHFKTIVANYLKDLKLIDKYGVDIKIPLLTKEELEK